MPTLFKRPLRPWSWALLVVSAVGIVFLMERSVAIGLGVLAVVVVSIWASQKPVAAAITFAFLTAAFPKAGVKIGGFPIPVMLFGLIASLMLMYFTSPRKSHPRIALILTGAYLAFVAFRAVELLSGGPSALFAFVAWAGIPIVLLLLSTSITHVDTRFIRAFQWGFVTSTLFAAIQLVGGVRATAIPGITSLLGDDLTQKNNVIYDHGVAILSKIPATYGNGNIYGLTAAVFLVFSLIRLVRRQGTKLDIVVAVTASLAIGVSGSRTAIVAAAIPVVILLFRSGSIRWRIGIVVLAVTATIAVFILEPGLVQRYTIDSLVGTGGGGRLKLWALYLTKMNPMTFIFGMKGTLGTPDGWLGLVAVLGLFGIALFIAAVVALTRRRTEWALVLVALLIGAMIDSSYNTFPTWFLPAVMFASTLLPKPSPDLAATRPRHSRRRITYGTSTSTSP